MSELRVSMIERLKTELLKSDRETFPRILGGQTTGDGLWRFFTSNKIGPWNAPKTWRGTWPELSPELFFFGEDIFGNQLTLKKDSENVWLWNHENGDLVDLLLDLATLLETVIQSGIDWIDFYSPEMLVVGRAKLIDVPENCHLHWTQPLLSGGSMTMANTSVVNSTMHLQGHGSLWTQLRGLPPGTEVIIKQKK